MSNRNNRNHSLKGNLLALSLIIWSIVGLLFCPYAKAAPSGNDNVLLGVHAQNYCRVAVDTLRGVNIKSDYKADRKMLVSSGVSPKHVWMVEQMAYGFALGMLHIDYQVSIEKCEDIGPAIYGMLKRGSIQ